MTVWGLFRRDMMLALRSGGALWQGLAFFVVTVTLFPLGVGPGPELLARIAAGILWVAMLLAGMLSLDRLFQADFEDGSLDQLLVSGMSPTLMVMAKCLSHWLLCILPLVLATPLLGMMLALPLDSLGIVVLAFMIGSPALTLIGAIGAALTLSARRGGVLLSLLVLPLYIPCLIFGVSAVEAALIQQPFQAQLMLLSAFSIVTMVFCPLAAAAALKLNVE